MTAAPLDPAALAVAVDRMMATVPWSSFWSPEDARTMLVAAIPAYLRAAGGENSPAAAQGPVNWAQTPAEAPANFRRRPHDPG